MKVLHLGILFSILFLSSCQKDPAIIEIREIELIGNWEAFEQTNLSTGETIKKEPQFLLDGLYCSAFELRDNNEYAIYYHRGGTQKPDGQLVHGSWRFEENKKLIFEFNSDEINVEIIELTEDNLIIECKSLGTPTQFKLNKN